MASPRAHQLMQLAASGRWWDVATAVAQSAFDDPDVLLIVARAWTEFGLRALAEDTLDRLCRSFPAAERHADVSHLRERIASLSDNRIEPSLIAHRAELAAAGLAARGVDLGDTLERWRAESDGVETFCACDGNVVRRRQSGSLQLVGNHRAASAALIGQHSKALSQSVAPITIEGLDPPWLAIDMLRTTDGEGYSPGIRIVQLDATELLDGISLADADEVAALTESDRVEWFVGESALTKLTRAVEAEPGVAHEGPVVPLATLRSRAGPQLSSSLQAAVQAHARDHDRCLHAIRQRDDAIGSASHIAALASSNPSHQRRIALIAGRFTTVLRPMIEDLASAFETLGCVTRIITEPNDHRRLTPHAYSNAFASFDPDLIVCVNYTRDGMDRMLGEAVMPRRVPWVTWVQDAMPHLLRTEAGEAVGPTDLAVGHISNAMREQFGYPADRSITAPMVASEQKFSPEHVDPVLAESLACEVAAFTNHSETPEQMRNRLIDEVSGSSEVVAIVECAADRALSLANEPIQRVSPRQWCSAMIDEIAPNADAESRENLLENVALRVYDRACRHAALGWARDVCTARGWRFSIYGNGWASHPTLGAHARGSLTHGTDICTAYHAARVSLDTSTLSSFHQRIAECTLAGGLPAVLATGSACSYARAALKLELCTEHATHGVPMPGKPNQKAFPVYRVPAAARFASFTSMLLGRSYPYAIVQPNVAPLPSGIIDADKAVGLLELGVWNAAALERVVQHAGDRRWRDAQRDRVLSFVRNHCTHAVLAERILGHYADLAATQTAAA